MLVYCGQTAGWIKMPLGMEVGLGPGHNVLDGYSATPKRVTAAPHFSAHVYCGQTVAHLSNCWARLNRLDVLPVTQPTVAKETQSTNPNQWPGIIVSSSTTGFLMEGRSCLYVSSPTSAAVQQVTIFLLCASK